MADRRASEISWRAVEARVSRRDATEFTGASGEVDASDIDKVIANFGSSSEINSDVDVGGEVDAADIDIVIANFGGTND